MRWIIPLILSLLVGISLPACQSEQFTVTSDNITMPSDNKSSYVEPDWQVPGYHDLLIIKYDTNSKQVWMKLFEQSGQSGHYPVAANTDSKGNFSIAGYGICENDQTGYCTIKYDASGNQLQAAPNAGLSLQPQKRNDIYLDDHGNVTAINDYDSNSGNILVRYDSNGKLLWSSQFQEPRSEYSPDIITVDRSGNTYILGIKYINGLYSDALLLKYDKEGNLLWNTIYSDPAVNGVTQFAIDNQGNVCILGYSIKDDFYRCVLAKFNADGRQVWTVRYSGPGKSDFPQDLELDSSGNAYLSCASEDVDWYHDYATIKYNSEGDKLWESRYSQPYHRSGMPTAMAIDEQGNVYVTGTSTIKYDCSGRELWVVEDLYATRLALDGQGNVYIAGRRMLDDIHAALDTVKLDRDGNVLWRAQYSKVYAMEYLSLNTDSNGNVYVISSLSRFGREKFK